MFAQPTIIPIDDMKKTLFAFMALFAMMTANVQTAFAQEEEKPLLTIGCLTDFHIEGQFLNYKNPGQPEGVKLRETTTKAIEGMKKENVDMLLLGGDYTSLTTVDRVNWNQAKQLLVDTLRAVFGDREYKPVVYVTGNHEFQAPGDAGNKWYASSPGSTKSWNSADYYTYPMKEDIGELSADDSFYEKADNFSLLAAFHYNILGVDVVALNTASLFYANASSYSYTRKSAEWCVNKIKALYKEDKNRTVIFLIHVPFENSNSLSSGKGMKGEDDTPEYLRKNLAKYTNLIMLYGHDHGGDNAMTQVLTSQRITRYNNLGNKIATNDSTHVDGLMPGDVYIPPFSPFLYLQNVANGKYLGKDDSDKGDDSNNLNMMSTPADISFGNNGIIINHNGSFYLVCNSSGNFSAKSSGDPSYIYEVLESDLESDTIVAQKASELIEGHYYIITQNGFVLGNSRNTDSNYRRVVGASVSGYVKGAETIVLAKSNNAAYIYKCGKVTENPNPAPTLAKGKKSFVTAFMGSLRFHTDSFNPNGDYEDSSEKEPIVVQGLVLKLYSNRIVFQMKNYGYTGTKNGITIAEEPVPYTVYQDVKLVTPESLSVKDLKSDAATGRTYNLFGQEVKPGYRGVAVRDGQKILIP